MSTVQSWILVLLAAAVTDNCVLIKFFGITPVLGCARNEKKIAALGGGVAVVMLLACAIAWPVYTLVLLPLGLANLQTFVFMLLILAVAALVNGVTHRCAGSFPMLALNCAALGVASGNAAQGLGYGESLLVALGSGLGLVMAMLIFRALDERVEQRHVPAAFRGLPVSLLSAAIVSMSLLAFK